VIVHPEAQHSPAELHYLSHPLLRIHQQL
jgi:hypothetical protein